MCKLGVKPEVASLALYSTHFVNQESALNWIYDEDDNETEALRKMNHPFVGCFP